MNLDEAEEFLSTRVVTRRTTFSLGSYLFGPQRAFVEDASTFATALCTRRAGKSVGVGAWLLEGPLKGGGPSLYFTGTRKDAKRIMWPILLRINREQGLGYESNESDLCLKLNGEPMVFLMGVNTRDEIDKARGTGWGRVAGDEAQMLPQYVHEMVNDVLMPSFMDHGGKLRLIGTPGAMPSGFFHAALQNPAWAHHSWSVWDNPHLPNARAMLAEALKARGVTEDDPSIQREWFGRWVLDLDSLVFKFDAARNTFASLPALRGEWQYVVGIDLGYDDADATKKENGAETPLPDQARIGLADTVFLQFEVVGSGLSRTVISLESVDLCDVRMIQRREDLRFTAEPRKPVWIVNDDISLNSIQGCCLGLQSKLPVVTEP